MAREVQHLRSVSICSMSSSFILSVVATTSQAVDPTALIHGTCSLFPSRPKRRGVHHAIRVADADIHCVTIQPLASASGVQREGRAWLGRFCSAGRSSRDDALQPVRSCARSPGRPACLSAGLTSCRVRSDSPPFNQPLRFPRLIAYMRSPCIVPAARFW